MPDAALAGLFRGSDAQQNKGNPNLPASVSVLYSYSITGFIHEAGLPILLEGILHHV